MRVRKILNIPVHFLQEVKDDKQQFELFAVAVLFKMNHVNSIVGTVTNKMLRKEIHCKHNVAQRIIDGMANSRFFNINPKTGCVFVPSFKSSDIHTFGRRRKKYQSASDYCKKLEIKNYTLREIKRALRELLIENTVHIRQTQQVQRFGKVQKTFYNLCVTDARKCAMTLEQIAKKFGLSKSSAWKYIDRMVNDGRVGKTQIVAECVIPELNEVTEREWLQRNPKKKFHAWHNLRSCGWTGWANYGCIYTIEARSVSESFKHVIWNHKNRLNRIVGQSNLESTPDGEAFWAKHN